LKTKSDRIFKLVIIALAVAAAIIGVSLTRDINDYLKERTPMEIYEIEEYYLLDGQYNTVAEWISRLENSFKYKPNEQEIEMGYVGKYHTQAVVYYALKATGNKRAEEYSKRMESYKSLMGQYMSEADKIDEMYGNNGK